MPYSVSAAVYHQFRDRVLALGNGHQRYVPGETARRGKSDREVARLLGLTPEQVTEIRCIAELAHLPWDTAVAADAFKSRRTARHLPRARRQTGAPQAGPGQQG